MLFVCALIGAVTGMEIFAVRPYGGAKDYPSAGRWYIPLFLGKILLSSIVFVLGISNLDLF